MLGSIGSPYLLLAASVAVVFMAVLTTISIQDAVKHRDK
jgi:hypothetical protein